MISQSQISLYLNCSKKYFYKYIQKREPSNETAFDNLFVGSFVHNFINCVVNNSVDYSFILYNTLKREEYFYDKEKFEKFVYNIDFNNFDFFKNYLKEVLKDNVFDSIFNDKQEVLKTKTNNILSLFQTAKSICEMIEDDIKKILENNHIESEKHVEVDDIHGYIDLIAFDVDSVKIFDFKVTKKERKFKKNIQDLLYVYLIHEKYNVISEFEYINIVYSNVNEVKVNISKKQLSYTKDDIEEAKDFIENFTRGVSNNVFIKNNSSFLCSKDFCEYFDFCQKYQNEEEINE